MVLSRKERGRVAWQAKERVTNQAAGDFDVGREWRGLLDLPALAG